MIGCYPGNVVRVYVRSGQLPGYRMGGRWRFKPEEVDAFVEAHRVDPASFPGREARERRRVDLLRRSRERDERRRAAR